MAQYVKIQLAVSDAHQRCISSVSKHRVTLRTKSDVVSPLKIDSYQTQTEASSLTTFSKQKMYHGINFPESASSQELDNAQQNLRSRQPSLGLLAVDPLSNVTGATS